MWFLVLVPAYMLGHLCVYAAYLRQKQIFRNERIIFLYHLFSWFLCVMIFCLLGFVSGGLIEAMLTGTLAAGSHGIYSLSFLELWSLTQGSYSLTILADVASGSNSNSQARSPMMLAEIGMQKRAERQVSLRKLGLLNNQGSLTPAGRGAALVVAFIIFFSKGRNLNR